MKDSGGLLSVIQGKDKRTEKSSLYKNDSYF